MLYVKEGFPEVNEIVKCTVKKIYGNTTFVHLDEYDKEGVLTISEIAPGRIRNLYNYVFENKEIICKVLRVNENENRIDLSLRRVSVSVMKDKLEETKKEIFAEKIYVEAAKELSTTKDDLFERTYEVIFENYETVYEALYDIMNENEKVSMFTKLNENERNTLVNVINERIKSEKVTYRKKFELSGIKSNGVDLIKDSLDKAIKATDYDNVDVVYLAAGKYRFITEHDDMKSADKVFYKFKEVLEKEAKSKNLELNI